MADLPVKAAPSPNRCASWSIPKDGAANISRRGWCSSRARGAGGIVLTRQEPAGKWGASDYSLVRTSKT